MELVDTHCHIHEVVSARAHNNPTRTLWLKGGKSDPDAMIKDANSEGVKQFICVGTTAEDSELAVGFVKNRHSCFASVGIHPHEAKTHVNSIDKLQKFRALLTGSKVVAIGECGLDYYYNHSNKSDQRHILELQLELAVQHNLPVIFHVREAFDDFWSIFDNFKQLKGVIHSFTADNKVLEQALARNLYIGLNGIMTFTGVAEQLEAAKAVPLGSLLLETDAPFLTPAPFRGKICEPKHVRVTAEFLSQLKGEPVTELARATTANARELFGM
jgi:TatD DNase family protein